MGRFALAEAQRPQRYVRQEGDIAYSSGNTGRQNIGQTDYLTGLTITSVDEVMTGGGTTAPSGLSGAGAFGALGLVQVTANGGRAPYSLPGYHGDVFYRIHDHDYESNLSADPLPTATGTADWVTNLHIPLTVDPTSERGAFFAGDTTLNLACALTFNPITSFVGTVNAATFAGSWDVWSEKFSAPQPDQSAAAASGNWLDKISFYHQTQLYGTFQLSNGTTNINLETDQDFVRVILIFYTGSLNAATFDPQDGLYTTLNLKINDVASIFDVVTESRMRQEMVETYKNVLPAGTAVLDFMRVTPPTRRDILPTDPNIAKRLTLQVASTSTNNYVDVITESMTDSPFAAKWVQLAQQRSAG